LVGWLDEMWVVCLAGRWAVLKVVLMGGMRVGEMAVM
jgi:hypothetical protein